MYVVINNDTIELPDHITIEQLISKMSYPKKVSVWINGCQILMKDYPNRALNPNDNIKIIKLLVGG